MAAKCTNGSSLMSQRLLRHRDNAQSSLALKREVQDACLKVLGPKQPTGCWPSSVLNSLAPSNRWWSHVKTPQHRTSTDKRFFPRAQPIWSRGELALTLAAATGTVRFESHQRIRQGLSMATIAKWMVYHSCYDPFKAVQCCENM